MHITLAEVHDNSYSTAYSVKYRTEEECYVSFA